MRLLNRPLWLEDAETAYPVLTGEIAVDVAVVGAGITGVTTALLLKQAGKTVALIEANWLSSGATGYTTAKLTVGHGLIYADLVQECGPEVAHRYASSNQQAIEHVARLVEEHELDCDFERASNYLYVEPGSPTRDLEREAEAARQAGVQVEETRETDLPFEVGGAIRVDGQAQFHPWKYVAALARLVAGDASHVFEGTRVTAVRGGSSCLVEAETGTVRAEHVVLATQLPILDRGLYFAKAHPTSSYAIAAPMAADRAPRGMYISVDQPKRSIRSAPAADGRRLVIVGGEGHRPGEEPDAHERYRRLERFLSERFDVPAAEYHWSTHDYKPLDKLPYIGRLRRGDDRIYVATGFAKWGMTKGTLAASVLTDAILGRKHPDAEIYDSTRLDLKRSAGSFLRENGRIGFAFFRDRARQRPGRAEIEALAPGEGVVARVGAKHYAAYRTEDGLLQTLSARCTHLGCIVGWNPADRAWECPCHGSRFAADGTVVQGPATADLPREPLPS
jgi:glycine/D-amino acid oxidase-like deaminating enzyme/nitrite reductase/ring-hydroxylating ferredoxin subunit